MNKQPTNEEVQIEISPVRPEDVYQTAEVFYKTWLATYPNKELGITEDDIHHRFQKKGGGEEFFENKKKEIENMPKGSGYLVARAGDRVVGLIVYLTNDELNEIRAIYVLPEYQGKGIGYRLWERALLSFDDNKDTFVNVADYNQKAINFYKKLGFVDTGIKIQDEHFRLKSGALIPEIRMVRKAKNGDL